LIGKCCPTLDKYSTFDASLGPVLIDTSGVEVNMAATALEPIADFRATTNRAVAEPQEGTGVDVRHLPTFSKIDVEGSLRWQRLVEVQAEVIFPLTVTRWTAVLYSLRLQTKYDAYRQEANIQLYNCTPQTPCCQC
jgi:hypothetical protein